ncbi:MAG TPA: glucoamylase family protein [Bacteroidales bacterium]|nr:glucoamylase family protein [Bacteroidales bacterium]
MDSYFLNFTTALDTTPRFPIISDDSLLTLVQHRTFDYFWKYAHPVSGLARERFGSNETVTIGGSGFGLMAMITGIERNFITRAQGFARLDSIVNFLSLTTTDKYHGVFPHWMNGTSGKTQAFSSNDNGADLVETAFLFQGLLTVQAYFKNGNTAEKALCQKIQTLWENVEWTWFQQNGQDKLYWHWSPDKGWIMNMPVSGWNEGLIIYVLAASSPTHSISKSVYTNGWAGNGSIRNGNNYYGITLPLGESKGGPLFFAHYSFLGLDPRHLSDGYANYFEQNQAHARINFAYCVANPNGFYGYGRSCWGLTASDIPNGYTASSPNHDVGVIAPTGALSSFPYTPVESMAALRFYYYTLGDKLWGTYGFKDAFSLNRNWFADSYLAIDQGPIVVMIENYRTGLLWNLFMSNSDVQSGLTKLGFTF